MAAPKRKTDIGPPHYEQFLPPTVKANYGKWKYHENHQAGRPHARRRDRRQDLHRQGRVLAAYQHREDKRITANLADKYCDGYLRFTSRNNVEFLTEKEAKSSR